MAANFDEIGTAMAKGPKDPFNESAEASLRKEMEALETRFKNEAARDLAYDIVGESALRREKANEECKKETDRIQERLRDMKYNSPDFNKDMNANLIELEKKRVAAIARIDREKQMSLSQLEARQHTLHAGPLDQSRWLTYAPEVEEAEEVGQEEAIERTAHMAEFDRAARVEPSYVRDFNKAAEPAADYTQEFNEEAHPEIEP